jgi:hypothetical protein
MVGSTSAERRFVHSFDGHKFDWRWEMLENICTELVNMWHILAAYWNYNLMSADGKLQASVLNIIDGVLCNTAFPGVELFMNTTQVVSTAVGRESRKMRSCFCHQHIYEECSTHLRVTRALEADGYKDGCCPWAGRGGAGFALGECDEMCRRVMDARSNRYTELMRQTPEEIRTKALSFEIHVKTRWAEIVKAKLQFWLHLPYAIVGLFGMFLGRTLQDSQNHGAKLLLLWEQVRDKTSAHRVSVHFFTSATLMCQLRGFISGRVSLECYPELFEFVLRYALLIVVGHFLEGRHRYMKLNSSGSSAHTLPSGQSAVMRRQEFKAMSRLSDFRNFVCVAFRNKTSLRELISHLCTPLQFQKLAYTTKIAMIYGFDVSSMFKKEEQVEQAVGVWAIVMQAKRALPSIKASTSEKLCILYFKSRFDVGATFAASARLVGLARSPITVASTVSPLSMVLANTGVLSRSTNVVRGDVIFAIVDNRPESKRYLNIDQKARGFSEVIVRVYDTENMSDPSMASKFTVESWDLRGWCSLPEVFSEVIGGLLRYLRIRRWLVG